MLETEHFALCHTCSQDVARALATRVEAVYRANVRFVRELRIPVCRPAHKLEVVVLGSHGEFRAYQSRAGCADEEALGFYEPASNRSIFFDLATHPTVANLRAAAATTRGDSFRHQRRSDRLDDNTQALLAKVIQHETAHQVHYNTGVLKCTTAGRRRGS